MAHNGTHTPGAAAAAMTRVLIADDHELFRRGIAAVLEDEADIEVVGQASSGPEAVQMARRLSAEVVLMDVRMPGGDGITATYELAGPGSSDPLPVIVMTSFEQEEYLFDAIESGASGFLTKSARAETVLAAVRAVAVGDGFVSPKDIRRVMTEFAQRRPGEPAPAAAAERLASRRAEAIVQAGLTPREVELIEALCTGLKNGEIARRLNIEAGSVRNRLSGIMKKLELQNRMQVIAWAFRVGIAQ